MGQSVFPAPATAVREVWTLIESKSATGTTVTFNSFSGYKHLFLAGKSITKSGSGHIKIRPNGNSTAGNYAHNWNTGNADAFLTSGNTSTAEGMSFIIYNVDKTSPKQVIAQWDSSVASHDKDAFLDTVAVTSLEVIAHGGPTFTGGTFYLYGILA
jgi:hypothetical protein